ncbi:MAG: acyltransferase, partial [Cyanobacteria bacterium J06649_11]
MAKRLRSLIFPHEDKTRYVKSLDGLRGLAVLIVMLSHTSNTGLLLSEYLDFSLIGKSGVYLFFVLSAYLLDRQIAVFLRRPNNGKSAYWKNYFLRRFLRIYPLFVIALISYALVSYLGFDTQILLADIVPHLLLQEGKLVFWSIPVEFKYYFISPLIMIFFDRVLKWRARSVLLSIVILMVGVYATHIGFGFSKLSTL